MKSQFFLLSCHSIQVQNFNDFHLSFDSQLNNKQDVWGPGGSEFFLFNNKLFVCYHAWTSPFDSYTAGGKRSLRIDEVTFITRNNVGIVPVVQVSDWNQTVTF